MLKSYLLENYGYNEPIFLNDLKIELLYTQTGWITR